MKIEKLEWDSDFFGFGIARLLAGKIEGLDKYARSNEIRLITSLITASRTKNIRLLERSGFEFVDLRVTFAAKSRREKSRFVRLAQAKDIPALKQIAGRVFLKESRFNHKNIEKSKARNLYRTWVEKSVMGNFDDFCLVAQVKGEIVGFATYKKISADNSSIGLIAVADGFQGCGIGSGLISACLDRACQDGRKTMTVATEGKNIAAQNFYIKNGFSIVKIESWYYKWVK